MRAAPVAGTAPTSQAGKGTATRCGHGVFARNRVKSEPWPADRPEPSRAVTHSAPPQQDGFQGQVARDRKQLVVASMPRAQGSMTPVEKCFTESASAPARAVSDGSRL